MNRPELYRKTVDIMVEAFIKGSLVHGNQCGCFIGNLLFRPQSREEAQELVSYQVNKDWFSYLTMLRKMEDEEYSEEDALEYAFEFEMTPHIDARIQSAHAQLQATGYSINEIDALEKAFEGSELFEYEDDRQDWDGYQGMMRVMDKLEEIHGMSTTTVAADKQRFVHETI